MAAIIPVLAMLATINVLAWWIVLSALRSPLTGSANHVTADFERLLVGYVGEMEALSGLPMTESMLAAAARQARSAQRRIQAAEMAEQWDTLSRDDMRVREILDSTLAETFRSVASADPSILNVYLVDSAGLLLAAAKKPPAHDFNLTDWWSLARKEHAPSVCSEGLLMPAMLGLALPIRDKKTAVFRGVLRVEIDAKQLVNATAGRIAGSARETIAVVGSAVVTPDGFANVAGEDESGIEKAIAGRKSGRHGGLHFLGCEPTQTVCWGDPLRVVFLRKEGSALWIAVGILAAFSAVSGLAGRGWLVFCRRSFARCVAAPQTELLEAGDWILRTALSRPSALKAVQDSAGGSDPHKAAVEATAVQKELQKWLHGLLKDLQEEYASHTHEMQRDLGLARDFQQAYMDRAYPKIPAVHVEGRLRLDFYHRYEPALALGGDFYNIMTLGPDCAGVFVSDVMGHGTRSALITAIIRTLIDDLESQGRNARHFLTEMNRQFCGLLKSVPNPLFASAFYMVADTTAHVATYSSAGHPAPFHLRRSVGRVMRMEVPMPRGAALGMIPDEKYTGGYCRLTDGDVFVFFTDGVYEAHNTHGEEFGIARMEDVLQRLMYKSAKEIVDGLMDAIATFVSYEPIMDDICIVAIEVTTKAAH